MGEITNLTEGDCVEVEYMPTGTLWTQTVETVVIGTDETRLLLESPYDGYREDTLIMTEDNCLWMRNRDGECEESLFGTSATVTPAASD